MDFKSFIEQAWHDHATDPNGVAQRLDAGRALVTDEPELMRLANLAHHLHGAHRADWQGGRRFIDGLAALPAYAPAGASGGALRRALASLALAEGQAPDLEAFGPSDRIRVGAMAASSLAEHDTARAADLLRDALDRAGRSGLAGADPMHRELAVAGNNLACTLEEKADRSADERALMILAAQAARHHWALAGTWLETERAEYRLAMTWLQAGDPTRAREHALNCVEIVAANDGAALERLFGWEALGQVERAAGNTIGHAQALAQARAAFASLDESDRAWCAESLEKLAADAPPG
jgi:hypothetical protein